MACLTKATPVRCEGFADVLAANSSKPAGNPFQSQKHPVDDESDDDLSSDT